MVNNKYDKLFGNKFAGLKGLGLDVGAQIGSKALASAAKKGTKPPIKKATVPVKQKSKSAIKEVGPGIYWDGKGTISIGARPGQTLEDMRRKGMIDKGKSRQMGKELRGLPKAAWQAATTPEVKQAYKQVGVTVPTVLTAGLAYPLIKKTGNSDFDNAMQQTANTLDSVLTYGLQEKFGWQQPAKSKEFQQALDKTNWARALTHPQDLNLKNIRHEKYVMATKRLLDFYGTSSGDVDFLYKQIKKHK